MTPSAEYDYCFNTLPQFSNHVIGTSDWISIGQDRIDVFAECTEDHQWIYTDSDRASRESPYGGTIAQGFLPLTLLSAMQRDAGLVPHDVRHVLSCGIERMRLVTPVKAGARLRARVELLDVRTLDADRVRILTRNTIESDTSAEPVMTADVEMELHR